MRCRCYEIPSLQNGLAIKIIQNDNSNLTNVQKILPLDPTYHLLVPLIDETKEGENGTIGFGFRVLNSAGVVIRRRRILDIAGLARSLARSLALRSSSTLQSHMSEVNARPSASSARPPSATVSDIGTRTFIALGAPSFGTAATAGRQARAHALFPP